jgi:WD40 repeat protein
LRHFISSPEPDLLYYASGADIYCLNVTTRTQAHVTTLPWDARCTASGHGYVCVGGADDGNFAAIKVAGFPPTDPSDVDALLPLDLSRRTAVPRPPLLGAANRIRLDKIGEEIVNSISIHELNNGRGGESEVVAVLTNNDKTVRVYSLTRNLETAVLDLPFPMNHATISPNGQLLVAVGDQNTAFFFERTSLPRSSPPKGVDTKSQAPTSEWTPLVEARLFVPDGSLIEGYFATAWSPSGRLCAVGSECGYITVFDVELLTRLDCEGEDAILQVISSSRPDVTIGAGAVRTMQFSPAPWDLLVWSEDQARVCVADIRAGLRVRQVLTLDPKEEDLERVEIADFDITLCPELHALQRETLQRRHNRLLENLASEWRSRHYRQLGVVFSDDDPNGLTPYERQIIDSLPTTRQIIDDLSTPGQREEGRDRGLTPRSVNYNDSRSDERRYRTATAHPFSSLRSDDGARERDSFYIQAAHLASNGEAEDSGLHTNSNTRPQVNIRRASSGVHAERRSSIARNNGNITDRPTTRSPGPIPPHARRIDAQIVSSTDEAWRTIEEALAINARAAENVRNATTTDPRNERRLRHLTQVRERLRSVREANPLDSYSISTLSAPYRRASRNMHTSMNGVRTTGLAMSEDGRTLYCGTEEGIFEFKMNLHERKCFPAIMPR